MRDINKTIIVFGIMILFVASIFVILSNRRPFPLSQLYLRILLYYLIIWIFYFGIKLKSHAQKKGYLKSDNNSQIGALTFMVENHPKDKTYTILRIMNIIGTFFLLLTITLNILAQILS